jgi:sugar phosphate isomerase/epimerase
MTSAMMRPAAIVASYYTLSGAANGVPSRHALTNRALAASAAGYDGIGLTLFDYQACLEKAAPEHLREVVDEAGVEVLEIEFLGFDPAESLRGPSDTEQALMGMSETFGARHVNVAVGRPLPDAAAFHDASRALAEIGKRCAEHNLLVAFEFMPFLPVRGVRDAVRLVEAADQPNVGLLLDSYHFFRGESALADLALVDPTLVVAFQLSDVPAEPPDDLLVETRTSRLLPGEGDLDLAALLRASHADGNSVVGVEILSDELRGLDLDDVAQRTFDATAGVWATYAQSVATPRESGE